MIKALILVAALMAVGFGAEMPGKKKPQIVDANHFYSQQNKEKTYTITNLAKDKPFAVVLKPTDSPVYDNPITLKITTGSQTKQCKFRSFEDLCFLDTSPQADKSLTVQCQKLPCNVEWRIYQTEAKTLQTTDKLENLYKIEGDSNRIIANIYCTSVMQNQGREDSRISLAFSDVPFETVVLAENSIFLIFDDVKPGYLYLNIHPKYSTCAKMRVTKGLKTLSAEAVEDFVKANKKVSYDLKDVPNNQDFVFEIAFHSTFGPGIQKDIRISVTGEQGGQRKTIRSNNITFGPGYKNFDLSYGVPKIATSQWKDIRLQIETENPILLTEIIYKRTKVLEVQATEFSYFDLKKGQKLSYHLIEEKKAQEKDEVKIQLSKPQAMTSSKQKCNVQKGCQFQIEAKEDIKGYIYIGSGTGISREILILDFGKELSFTHKIKELQEIYITKTLQLKKAVQVTVNSPNVLVYMANTNMCQYPSETCYENLGNMNRHFIYYPDTENQTKVMFLIRAIDTGTFTLTLLPENSDYVELKDSQPFVYLFDSKEQSLRLRFKREDKVDVNFNLIAPLHALDLIVENGKKLPEDEDAKISAEGYLQFKASDAPKSDFTILVRKREGYAGKFVHFTLIASTKGKHIRLESGITHYETLTKSDSNNAEYIFQFDPNQNYVLNFYCHNTKEKDVNIKLTLRALSSGKQKSKDTDKTLHKLIIDKPSDALELSEVSAALCSAVDDDQTCQIAIQLQNQMDIELDIAITLMSMHSILEIKDGIWQSFPVNAFAKSAHFYFHPRNKDHDIGIMFKTTDPAIRLKYRLFYAQETEIDISQWPFPSEVLSDDDTKEQKKHRPINHFSISKSSLHECWPNCMVLISMIDLEKDKKEKDSEGTFSVLASNSLMEIPEKTKIDITLKEGETKGYLVDLKYALDIEQNIYFYIHHSIGLTSVFANVYSEKNDRVPDQEQFDFSLNSEQEFKIPIDSIKKIIKDQEMGDDLNIYLYVVVESLSDAKLNIEFTFNQINQVSGKYMDLDTVEHLMLGPNQQRIYYFPIDRPYEVKVVREKGFPIYFSRVCKEELDKCLEDIKTTSDKGEQMLTKVAAYTAQPCDTCFYVFKIKTDKDPTDVSIHLQSGSSEIELVENKPVYDFTEKDQPNSYTFYAIRGEEIYLNIAISEGEIEAEISDLAQIKQSKAGKSIISFIIPAQYSANKNLEKKTLTKQEKAELQKQEKSLASINQLKNQNSAFSQALMSAFGLSDKFLQMHVTIKSVDPKKPSIYTITYSSGERQFQLQDGLITNYILQPKKQAVFYYSSAEPNHIYLTLSMEKSAYLKDLQVTIKSCTPKNHIIDDDCWVGQKSDKPNIKDKTPHPTLMYLLPNKNHLAIMMDYKGDHSEKISLGINHQEIMILPFDVEFPFILHNNQNIEFLVELSNSGYIQIITRKCDESTPLFSYTFDYDSFQKGEFTYEAELGATPKSRFMSKVKPGTLYMQMKTPPTERSLLSVYVHFSEKKTFDPEILAGNKGDIEYSIKDSQNAELKFKPPTCPDSTCPKFKYFLMTATNMRDLYTQLVCPSNFFTNVQFLQGAAIKLNQVSPKENSDGTLTVSFSILDQISYVGIKATNGKEKEVFYKPLEIVTFWGQLSRTSHSHKLFIASIFVCSMVAIIIFVRRSARGGYKPLPEV